MHLVYNLLLYLYFILALPLLLFKFLTGKATQVKEQLGFLPRTLLHVLENQTVIWVHGVSVGETVAASPICAEIRKQFPHVKIVFSTVTTTGRTMAEKLIPADAFIYFPFDLPMVVKKVLTQIKPVLVVIMETELWPNLIKTANHMGIKVVLANGRISERSFRRYRLLGSYFRDMLRRMDALIMQSMQDVDYALALGAEKKRVYYFGNTKYDLKILPHAPGKEETFQKELQLGKVSPILVVGSTHDNEEELFISIYKRLKAEFPDLVMILAPRHPDRVKEIEPLYKKAGIPTVRRTELAHTRREAAVIFIDTIGELLAAYRLADLVFVGGSLVKFGGHNILEPAVYGRPIFVGPYMDDFKDILGLFLNNDACIQVQDHNELAEKMLYYLKHPVEAELKGRNALRIVEENQGAAEKVVDLLAGFIPESPAG
ncbi:MAG TPA: 3-deoxy-D-manno-octulosonic acid transferase [Firmicutes bacterium]|nr:3-deoxy-D-manno-octulosonic acid transferase [Bacillota bacterium]